MCSSQCVPSWSLTRGNIANGSFRGSLMNLIVFEIRRNFEEGVKLLDVIKAVWDYEFNV